jgi:predicted Ser/Thr protein kinase
LLRIGETIDRYRVEALLGQGGMAAVYRARHLTLDSEHAIKVLFITAPQVRARLLREGRVQANLRNPNIVSVTDVLEVQGAPALVMEYVDGPALDEWLTANRPTLDQALWLFRGILRGIHAAHERGVVHRDLKPANIVLGSEGGPRLIDFGIARLVGDGHGDLAGTPGSMSPEQARGLPVDARSDLFALGCVAWECLAGRPPFPGGDPVALLARVLFSDAPRVREARPEVPAALDALVARLLERDRDRRPAGACDVAATLRAPEGELAPAAPGELRLCSVLVARPARTIHGPTEHDGRGASSRRSDEGVGRGPTTEERRTDAPQIGRQATEEHELSGLSYWTPRTSARNWSREGSLL